MYYLFLLFIAFSPNLLWAIEPYNLDESPKPSLPSSVQQLTEPTLDSSIGLEINHANVAGYKSILIPEVLSLIADQRMALRVFARKRYASRLSDSWMENSGKSSQSTAPKADLKIVEQSYPFLGPNEIGQSFAAKDSDKDLTAQKLLWNVSANFWVNPFFDSNIRLGWFDNQTLRRRVDARFRRAYTQLLNQGDKSEQLFRERFDVLSPLSIVGFSWLTYRFRGIDEDMFWVLSPANMAQRQLSGSNRSDPFLNSDLSHEDLLGWSGKPSSVKAHFKGLVSALVPFAGLDLADVLNEGSCSSVPELERIKSGPSASNWNFEARNLSLAAGWSMARAVFVPRKLWHLELESVDPYSLYGRQVLYVDAATLLPVYKFVFDRAGRPYKSIISSFGLAAAKDRDHKFYYPSSMLLFHHKNNRQNLIDYARFKVCKELPESSPEREFDPKSLDFALESSQDSLEPEAVSSDNGAVRTPQ